MKFRDVLAVGFIVLGIGAWAAPSFEAANADRTRMYHVRTLPSLGGANSRGNGIDDRSLVTGFSNLAGDQARRATVWNGDTAYRIDPLGGTNSSVAWSGKNNGELVVGISQTSEPQTRP